MICLSKAFLDFFIPASDERLNMKRYKLIGAENPSNGKKIGVAIYYEEFLAVRSVKVKNLNECVKEICGLTL